MLERLNRVNDVPVYAVTDPFFQSYGRVISNYDFSSLIAYMEEHTDIPAEGNIYVASVPEMEAFPEVEQIQKFLFGDMPIQVGYCNGRNSTYNGFEYHKGSEINVAVTDFMLILGHVWEITKENTYHVEDAKVFFVPKGTAIEMYQTTLHLSPAKVTAQGFKGIVILPRGTNTPLEEKTKSTTGEERLLLQRNKWVIAHPEREPLIKQGAFPGLLGENKELYF